ncbi:uracil-DNA glycosylase family protein [Maribacter sp. 2307ULW6-5]|uniref:uracil-DNA glycosylase family protein n=1 Tax=Maribacter sp. 2307ULW6-5 TaxID=3386275 RepID=UPI0039BC693B
MTKLIVGTLPPPRFTTKGLKPRDVDFCYGSRDGQFWPIMDRLFQLNLEYATTASAVEQRKRFLRERGIGICDIVASARRKKVDASDVGMEAVVLRDVLGALHEHPTVHTLLFTGGNSKNGPEYFFRKHLAEHGLRLTCFSDSVPRIHGFVHPITQKELRTVSLTAPSGAANRAVGSLEAYKDWKRRHPKGSTIDYRAVQYKPFF